MYSIANRDSATGPLRVGMWVVAAALGLFLGGCGILGLGGDGSGESESGGPDQKGPAESSQEDAGGSGPTAGEEQPDAGTLTPPSLAGSSDDAASGPTRNPFAPQVEVDDEEEEETDDEIEPKKVGILQKHPLEEYRLVGIISEVAIPKAMFIAPDGKGYLVKESEALGREGGIVKDIRSNTVEIEVPQGEDGAEAKTISRELRDLEISAQQESDLSPREQETLEKLMESEEGREALQERFEKQAPAANSAEQQEGERPGQRRRRKSGGERGERERERPQRESPE